MIPLHELLNFTATALVLAALPGPDSLFVLSQSALRGPRAGLALTLGLCTGLSLYSIAVALGVAALFQTSPLAFTVLKGVGSAYLLYLAWSVYHAGPAAAASGGPGYRRGVFMNLTNPKVALFFLAFLPKFTSPAWGNLTQQLLILGALMVLTTLFVFSLFSLLAGLLSRRLQQSGGSLNRVTALIFLLLAGRLLM